MAERRPLVLIDGVPRELPSGDDTPVGSHTHPSSAISDSTAAGRALLTAADAAAQRTSLGLASAALASILGTVSQSGGVPTGAILERGSNANGEYVRFADGTQICTRVLTSSSNPTTWTFPAAFSTASGLVVVGNFDTGANTAVAALNFTAHSTTGVQFKTLSVNNGGTVEVATIPGIFIRIVSIGRWF